MNIIEYTGTLPLPDGVYARYFRPGCDNKVEFVRELAEPHYMVLRGLDSDAYLRTYRLNKGDLILYDGDRREVVEKDTLAHKFLQETILPTALDRINVRRMMSYIKKVILASTQRLVFEPDIEQKKIWDKVGSKPENAETSTGVDDIESTGVLGDNVPYTHLNYESHCWRTPYDKDTDHRTNMGKG